MRDPDLSATLWLRLARGLTAKVSVEMNVCVCGETWAKILFDLGE
jgi:hypothetical protein